MNTVQRLLLALAANACNGVNDRATERHIRGCTIRSPHPFLSPAKTIKAMLTHCIVGCAIGLMASTAFAQTYHQTGNLTVRTIFSERSNTGGFYPVENIAAECLWGLMYLDLSAPSGRAQLALLMEAKVSNRRLTRVDYHKNVSGYPAGTCVASGIHVE